MAAAGGVVEAAAGVAAAAAPGLSGPRHLTPVRLTWGVWYT